MTSRSSTVCVDDRSARRRLLKPFAFLSFMLFFADLLISTESATKDRHGRKENRT